MENYKSSLLRFLGLALGIPLMFGIQQFLTYLSNCCVKSTGALLLVFLAIVIGIILTSLALDKCMNYINYLYCQDRKSKDEENEDYLFGYS